MQTIKIKNGQCFLDVVLEATGSIDNFFLMALANNVSITDQYSIGNEYKVVGEINKNYVSNLQLYVPATGGDFVEDLSKTGISFWTINKDFIVSRNE